MLRMLERLPTAAMSAAGLICGYGVAVASGSRPVGGAVLAIFGITCIAAWLARDGRVTTVRLTVAGLIAFALSHALGLLIGAWPAVLITAAALAALCWRESDAAHLQGRRAAAR
jgi:hypothetical protein